VAPVTDNITWVVDDNRSIRDSTGAFLKSMGHTVRTCASAMEFLDEFDFVAGGCLVVDYDMPAMTGLELLELLRDKGNSIPVIVITGRGDSVLEQRVLAAGGLKMLHKPVDGIELADLVERAMQAAA